MAQSGTGAFSSRYQFQNAFLLAMDSIRAHKLRASLTILGLTMGVATLITVMRS